MANPISRAWRKLFYQDGGSYFLLPKVDSSFSNPPNEGPFGDAGPPVWRWIDRMTYGGRHATPFFYTVIGVMLGLLTVVEVYFFTIDDFFGGLFVTVMLLLALLKFIIVVAFFMHLRFDKNVLTLVFTAGFLIAIFVFVIMLNVQGQFAPAPLVAP
jgi:cytochrome c oxidase subunit 4